MRCAKAMRKRYSSIKKKKKKVYNERIKIYNSQDTESWEEEADSEGHRAVLCSTVAAAVEEEEQ